MWTEYPANRPQVARAPSASGAVGALRSPVATARLRSLRGFMNVLFLSPPSPATPNVIRDVMYGCWCKGKRIGGATLPPLGLLMTATVARDAGFDVRLLDAPAEGIDLDGLLALAPGFDAVVAATSTMTVNEDARVLAALKGRNVRLRTVVFGSHPTFMPRHTLEREGIDVIVRHEPEYVVRDLLAAWASGGDAWKSVPGIGWREAPEIVLNPPARPIEPLDDLPFADRHLLAPGLEYFNPVVRRLPYTTMITSRGCAARCSFCTAPAFYGTALRARSADSVLAELRHLAGQGYREVYFRDETFTLFRERNREICHRILDEGLDLAWICNARVGTVDLPSLQAMKAAGCHLVKFGVESGNQGILDRARKGITVEATRQAFAMAAQAGLDTHAHVMVGMPGETRQTLRETLGFVKSIRPSTASFGICTPYPGTALFDEVAKARPAIRDGADADLSVLHTRGFFHEAFTDLTARELAVAVRRAHVEFYLRPGFLAGHARKMTDLQVLRSSLKAGWRILDFSLRGE
jgi:anaerobic magnesium-protoporphyrin IX monomethyl ester cyclase